MNEKVYHLLQNIKGLQTLKELFWSELNYNRENQSISKKSWKPLVQKALAKDPVIFATGGADEKFKIVYSQLDNDILLIGQERAVANELLKQFPYSLFIFANREETHFHLVNIKEAVQEDRKRRLFRRISLGPEERIRTASERISLLDLESISGSLLGLSALDILKQHDEAFDVEQVTRKFFEGYKNIYKNLEKGLFQQTKDRQWAHDYSLQFLNRCMFLYFVQRKGWLGEEREFLYEFWKAYQKSNHKKDEFVDNWLKVLFFEAFNRKYVHGRKYFPDPINKALSLAPYLNGGLFVENDLDKILTPYTICDDEFEKIFNYLEQYNFTISEDSPLDQEVAVDPEMIGIVYESLVNVSDEVDERGEAGIYYTPRTEIDLMCRLALADNLVNHLGENNRTLIQDFVFAFEDEEKSEVDQRILKSEMMGKLLAHLSEISIVDPACGSGSFLVGMLHVLDNLRKRLEIKGTDITNSFDRRKEIIGNNLYGVDVMEWACHIAELRLWLALVVEADFTREELHVRKEPLLPHFSFKIRCGDSLVQELGGINLSHIKSQDVEHAIKLHLNELKKEKMKFYRNETERKYKTKEQLEKAERTVFKEILSTRAHKIRQDIKKVRNIVNEVDIEQLGLMDGKPLRKTRQLSFTEVQNQNSLEEMEKDLTHIEEVLKKFIDSDKKTYFAWDIAFVEVFYDGSRKFDIVIGNPPYVRQESIAAPSINGFQITQEKKDYKDKLMKAVYAAYPEYFYYDVSGKKAINHTLDAKNDLYVYFYFMGLNLLNPQGSFCFITSNSWLDVGYGKNLQEFLLCQSEVKLILDNQFNRSFRQADVNTIIALLAAPEKKNNQGLNKTARFALLKIPYEEMISPVLIDEILSAAGRITKPEYRINALNQKSLLEEGMELSEEDDDSEQPVQKTSGPLIKVAKYIGNKWGGKYLRAPDIYWTILEKGKGKMVKLGDVAEVRFGIKTGANEFFYLDKEKIDEWGIEKEFLKPVIKSPRECKKILIELSELKNKLFICHKDIKELKGTAALEYIKWGQTQGFHQRPSCSSRRNWWDLGVRRFPDLLFNYLIDTYAKTYVASKKIYCSDNFQELYVKSAKINEYYILLNSTIFQLILNVHGRSNFGDGLLKIQTYEVEKLPLISLDSFDCTIDINCFKTKDDIDNRKIIDDMVFSLFKLNSNERNAVYEAVNILINARLKKAGSV